MTNKCPSCMGTGKLMGGGMITVTCHNCHGSGSMDETKKLCEDERLYKKSIKRIREYNKDITYNKAHEILKQEMEKINNNEPKP